jgi:subtilase family serine protease
MRDHNHRRRALAGLAVALAAAAIVVLGGATTAQARPTAVARPLLSRPIAARPAVSPEPTSACLTTFGIHCYSPAQFEKAYDLGPLHAFGVNGSGQTIAIVDSFGSPTIANDLHQFDQTFGVSNAFGVPVDPAIARDPKLTIIQPAGPVPAFDPSNDDMVGWAQETTLDVEWAHVMAPKANILLVETPVSETEGVQGFPEIVKAENYVIDHHLAGVISQSFGATENTFPSTHSLLALRDAIRNADRKNVTVLGASGDTGSTDYELNLEDLYPFQVNSWPSSDPLVTSVGGTQMTLDDAGHRLAPDVVWNDGFGAGGGGPSHVFGRPDFQDHVRSVVGPARGTPDISLNAAVDGGVWVYYTFVNPSSPYHIFGGTSAATPEFAGVVAMADQLAGKPLGNLNDALYSMHGPFDGIVDVTQGNNDIGPFTNTDGNTYHVPGYSAGAGYDLASGLGTIDGAKFVPSLVIAACSHGHGHATFACH